MTMTRGIAKDYHISLGFVKLNKACSLVHVFWQLDILPYDFMPEQVVDMQKESHKEYIETVMKERLQGLQKQQEEDDYGEEEVRFDPDQMTPEHIL